MHTCRFHCPFECFVCCSQMKHYYKTFQPILKKVFKSKLFLWSNYICTYRSRSGHNLLLLSFSFMVGYTRPVHGAILIEKQDDSVLIHLMKHDWLAAAAPSFSHGEPRRHYGWQWLTRAPSFTHRPPRRKIIHEINLKRGFKCI